MSKQRLARFESFLSEERARILDVIRRIEAASLATVGAGAPSPFGDEPYAGAAGARREDDVAIAAREAATLAEVDDALRRLHDEPERFGICVTCGRQIPAGRLEIVPATRYCERHADRR